LKILLLDIETAPNTAHVWGLWQQNVGLNQLMESSYVLCWAAKWLGKDETLFNSVEIDTYDMLAQIHGMLDEADVVVHYNGTKFDIPTLNKEFILNDLSPPSPYYQVDLLRVARNQFKFASNKLAYVAEALGLTPKVKHIGHELWIRCMSGDPEAWAMMKQYNMGDVITLEEVYYKFLPWIKHHPNRAMYSDDKLICPNCGGKHYHSRGTMATRAGIYKRYSCQDCGTWFRGNKNESTAKQYMLVA
jgi:DNA polymerase elongation subunit (family B)/predicted RNA-binding Zn-ribbon protein involved in translation (DUF1610 family)